MQYKDLSRELENKKDLLVESTMECIYKDQLEEIKDTERAEKSINDLEYIISYLAESVYFNNKALFKDFSIWLNNLFENINLGEDAFITTYKCLARQIEQQFKPEIILGIGTIATAAAFSLNLFVINYILHIDIIAQLEEQMKLVTATYQQLGVSSDVLNQVSQQLIATLETTFPTLILCSGLLIAGVNYYVSTKVLTTLDFDYPYQLEVEKFRLTKIFIFVYLVAILFSANPILENIYILSTFLFSLQGVAVVYHYYLEEQLTKIHLILGVILFPIVVNLLFFVGVFDLWFDFRNLEDV